MPRVNRLTEEKRIEEQLLDELHIACRRKSIKQKHIAAELGISQAAVSKLMSGKSGMSLEQFIAISLMAGRRVTNVSTES